MFSSINDREKDKKLNRLFTFVAMSKEDIQKALERLLNSMVYRTPVTFVARNKDTNGNVWINDVINKIEAEDGSGRRFNIDTMTQGTFFIQF